MYHTYKEVLSIVCVCTMCCAEEAADSAADRCPEAADSIADKGGKAGAIQADAGPGDGPWTLRSLRRGFGDRLFKVGEDDDGYKVKVKMKHFLRYLSANRDDSPLYVFDGD